MKTITFIALIALFVALPNSIKLWVYVIGVPSLFLIASYILDKHK